MRIGARSGRDWSLSKSSSVACESELHRGQDFEVTSRVEQAPPGVTLVPLVTKAARLVETLMEESPFSASAHQPP